MTTQAIRCQACRRDAVEVFVDEDDPVQPYQVCAACARRLRQFALRPLEWFNLAAIHGPSKFLLHEDFYCENGKAAQPEEEVDEPERFLAPTLEQVSGNLERLLDYAMTLYFLDAPTVMTLGQHDKSAILASLSQLQQDRFDLSTYCHAFAPFHSHRTLDWIEAHSVLVKHENWGRVAAQSNFSWPRAIRWLEQGRPLSHIALFALQACHHYDTIPLRKYRPVLEEAAPINEMRQRLETYHQADPVPRVRGLIENIGKFMTGASQER